MIGAKALLLQCWDCIELVLYCGSGALAAIGPKAGLLRVVIPAEAREASGEPESILELSGDE